MNEAAEFTIVGNGLAGALLACGLARAGHTVELFEKRPDPRQSGPQGGRSINLALSVRGLHALTRLGLAETVLRSAVIMRGRMIHPVRGRLAFQPYGKDDSEALYSVSRGRLNRLLAEEAVKQPGVRVHFDHRCVEVDLTDGTLTFDTPTGERRVRGGCIVGADGAYSAVRAALQKIDRTDYSQSYLTHGYKELTIPAAVDGGWRMEPHALHIWPRGDHMMIALPNADGSFTCTLFWPFDGPHGFARLTTERQVVDYFTEVFPDAVPLIPDLGPAYLANPVGSLVTVRVRPWRSGGRAVLVGDAAHAVVPFLGQGMNASFEDCTTLIDCLGRHADRADAFAEYERLRKDNADVLADLCLDNFIEMRDKVGSPLFLMKKKVELGLNKLLPNWYVPLYTMIEFTRIPYAEALARARRQNRVVLGWLAALAAVAAGGLFWVFR
jgi:kynurenine 3-monooxygenase